jgi:hypothetical protein
MYHNNEEDLYTPCIKPAAMPSRSKYTPYFSRRADGLEDFLEEFEGRAFNCIMTDPQQVDALPCYTDLIVLHALQRISFARLASVLAVSRRHCQQYHHMALGHETEVVQLCA